MATHDDFAAGEIEENITEELTLAESNRPDDPLGEPDLGSRPNPTNVKAYETGLATPA